jgi:hypothetical protein
MTVHLVWHPDCAEGGPLGTALFRALFEDVADLTTHGIRIPVRLWTGTPDGATVAPPTLLELDTAEHSVIVVLVDAHLLTTEGWPQFLADLAARCQGRHLLLPVAVSPRAVQLPGPVAEDNWIRLHGDSPDRRVRYLVNRVAHALLRLLDDRPLTVFLSHAKLDGELISLCVRRFLHEATDVRDWFDAHDLPPGRRWEDAIRGAASRSLLLAVRSEAFATREWCRIEVLEAKLAGSPVVVLDAFQRQEERSFPYLGNGPVVRLTSNGADAELERLLTAILLEALRYSFFPRRVQHLCRLNQIPEPAWVFARPPELVTMLGVADVVEPTSAGTAAVPPDRPVLAYPDPPLGTEEMGLIRRMAPHVCLATPTQLLAGG